MAWRFRKRITIFPGIKINLSTGGISTTFGPRGASVNVGKKGVFLNAGIPGTGFYNRIKISDSEENNTSNLSLFDTKGEGIQEEDDFVDLDELESIGINKDDPYTSDDLKILKEKLIGAYKTREEIKIKINSIKSSELAIEKRLKLIRYIPLHKFLLKRVFITLEQKLSNCQNLLDELRVKLEDSKLGINFNIDAQLNILYETFLMASDELIKSKASWYISNNDRIYPSRNYSWANSQVRREEVNLEKRGIDFIKSKAALLHFGNRLGPDFYFFIGWLMVVWSNTDFSLINLKDLTINFETTNFIEENEPPSDAFVVKYSWKYTNKDGTKDKRYSNNFPVYIVQYGEIHFSTNQGLDEVFQFSNSNAANVFVDTLNNYKNLMGNIDLKNSD